MSRYQAPTLHMFWLAIAGYVVALLLAWIVLTQDRIIHRLTLERQTDDEAASQCQHDDEQQPAGLLAHR